MSDRSRASAYGRDCEVCGRPLCPRGPATTGLCSDCRQAGAAFARGWMEDLREKGLSNVMVAAIVGTTEHVVRARLSERRLAMEVRRG